MGKTVKSRTIVSIASFVLVLALCIVANSSVPGLYKSYKERVIAQQAAARSTQTVQKAQNTPAVQEQPEVPADTAPVAEETPAVEDSNVFDIPETPVVETPAPAPAPAEPATEEEPTEIDIEIEDGEDEKESKGGIFDIIINLFKSLFEKLTSLDILGKIKDFFAGILKIFGIEL